jgi:hypothetical protein
METYSRSYFSLVRPYLLAGRDAVVLDSTLVVLVEPATCTANILVSNRRVLALMTRQNVKSRQVHLLSRLSYILVFGT